MFVCVKSITLNVIYLVHTTTYIADTNTIKDYLLLIPINSFTTS